MNAESEILHVGCGITHDSCCKTIFKSQLCPFIEMASLKTLILCTTETHDSYGLRFMKSGIIYGPDLNAASIHWKMNLIFSGGKYTHHVDQISGESVTTVIGQVLAMNECTYDFPSLGILLNTAITQVSSRLVPRHFFFIAIFQ